MPMDWGLARDYAARDVHREEMRVTEAEWLAATDSRPMLEFVGEDATDRKLRLFGVAVCRRIWSCLTDQRSRIAIEVAELYADGEADEHELENARHAAGAAAGLGAFGGDDSWGRDAFAAGTAGPARAAAWAATWRGAGTIELSDAAATAAVTSWHLRTPEFAAQADLLRCIFGPLPFRSITIQQACLSSEVVRSAGHIYVNRAFDRLPLLADALEDAGCTDTDLLGHLRGPGPHVRGCWAVDLVLGKS
jgi:hypothetical protein